MLTVAVELTKALVQHKGFNIIAVEADWPDAYRANRWVRGIGRDPDDVGGRSNAIVFPFTTHHRRPSRSSSLPSREGRA